MRIMHAPLKSGMKFKSGINSFFGIGFFALTMASCVNSKYPISQSHTFQYTRVTKNGEPLFAVLAGDTMNLNSNGSFNYCIKEPGKNATGTWKLLEPSAAGHKTAFEFTYAPDNQKRIFEICRYTGKTLILCEGPLRFEYKSIL